MSQCDVPEASIFTYRKKTTDQYEPQQDEEHEEVQTELKTSSTEEEQAADYYTFM